MIHIRKSQTKPEESIISEKTRDTNKLSIPSISPFSSFKTLSNNSQTNLQDFIKNVKKEIVFEDTNNKEIMFSSEKKNIPKIKIKDSKNLKKSQTSEENNSNNSSLKENDYQKKKQFYDANKYLDILSSTINGKNYNLEEEDDNDFFLLNNDYQNLDEIVLNNPSQTQNISKRYLQKSVLSYEDKKDIDSIRKKIENKLGNDITKSMIKYVSDNTNKELLQFDKKQIEYKIRKDYENKKLNIQLPLLNESIQLLPEIYSVIIADRMEEN